MVRRKTLGNSFWDCEPFESGLGGEGSINREDITIIREAIAQIELVDVEDVSERYFNRDADRWDVEPAAIVTLRWRESGEVRRYMIRNIFDFGPIVARECSPGMFCGRYEGGMWVQWGDSRPQPADEFDRLAVSLILAIAPEEYREIRM